MGKNEGEGEMGVWRGVLGLVAKGLRDFLSSLP